MKARFIVLWSQPTDVEAFEEHYHKIHLPVANRMKRLKSYTVSSDISVVRGKEPYYIIAVLEWDSMDDLRQDMQSPEGRAASEDVELLSQWSPGVRSMTFEVNETHDQE